MRLASFDVFDTLLTRDFAAPADVFVEVGRRLGRPEFPALRQRAERAARMAASHGETTLERIYERLADGSGWDPPARDAAMALELAIEEAHIHPVEPLRAIVGAARLRGDRIVFISDMYLPGALIESWLKRAGFYQEGDLLFVSGDVEVGKGSGRLFEHVRQALDASFERWVHHGDHPWSDFAKPRGLGIDARRVAPALLSAREQSILRPPVADDPGVPLLAGTVRRLRVGEGASRGRARVLHEVATGVAGPLFYGFARWCLQEAEHRGIRRLYFLSRGGQVLCRVAQEIGRVVPSPVECRYLYSSRLAYACPAAADDPLRLRPLLAPATLHHSIRQAVAASGLAEDEARAVVPAELGADWDRNLAARERERLADALLGPAGYPSVRAALTARAGLAREYLRGEGFPDGALVDTGWAGTIQTALGRLLGGSGSPRPLTGFYLGVLEQAGLAGAGERIGYTNTFNRLPLRRQTSHLPLLELLAQADHGPLAGFERGSDGRAAPRLDPPGPADLDEIRAFQEGVLAFARAYLRTAGGARPPAASWHRAAIELYRDFHRRPSPAEAAVFGEMPHADQWKESAFDRSAPPLGLAGVCAAMASRKRRPPGWWIEGQAARGSAWMLHAYAGAKRLKWTLQTALTGLRD